MSTKRNVVLRSSLLAAVWPVVTCAADRTFVSGLGDWDHAVNWLNNLPPTAGDNVLIPTSSNALLNDTFITDQQRIGGLDLRGTLTQSYDRGGATRLATQYTRITGGTYSHADRGEDPAVHDVALDLTVGSGSANHGRYVMSGGGLNVGRLLQVGGDGGTGSFVGLAGTIRAAMTVVDVSSNFLPQGNTDFETGSMMVYGSVSSGHSARLTVNGPLSIIGPYVESPARGDLQISGHSLSVATNEFIQRGARVQHTGGNHSVANDLYLGFQTPPFEGGGAISMTLSRYELLNVSPAQLSVGQTLYAGHNDHGEFNQNGWNVQSQNMTLGVNTSPTHFTNPTGTYNQYAGSNTVAQILRVGGSANATGIYNLAGGKLKTGLYTIVGGRGTGIFSHNGGTHETSSLNVGFDPFGNASGVGRYSLFEGVLNTETARVAGVGASPLIDQLGGVHNNTNQVIVGHDFGTGVYHVGGGSLTTPTLIIGQLASTGTVDQEGGTVTANTLVLGTNFLGGQGKGTYKLRHASAKLNSTNVDVGATGLGIFEHHAGTHAVAQDLSIATYAGSEGTYSLGQGAVLNVAGRLIGGNSGRATININGGDVIVGDYVRFAQAPGSSAMVNISGNANLFAQYGSIWVGYGGEATLTQRGGTVLAGSTVQLATTGAAPAVYNLEDGVLVTPELVIYSRGTFNMSGGMLRSFSFARTELQNYGVFNQTGGDARIKKLSGTGTYNFAPGATLTTNSFSTNSIQLAASGTSGAQLIVTNAPSPGMVNNRATTIDIVSPDSIPQPAQLDLANTNLIISGAGATPLSQIRDYLIDGYAGGTWNGPGIISSSSATDPTFAIGYATASDILGPAGGEFAGDIVSPDSLILRYTLRGDTNLDGQVSFADLLRVASNFGDNSSDATWNRGDFDYDGNVGFTDLLKVASNFGQGLPAIVPGASDDFNQAWAAAVAQVPEPFIAAMLPLLLLRRRRRLRGE